MGVKQLFAVTVPGLAYICLGGFVVVFSMFSLLAREKIYLNEVVFGTAFGIFMGPYFAGYFDPRSWTTQQQSLTLEVMRITLAIGLFAIGVELPQAYMLKHARSLITFVVPTMAIGWVIVAGLLRLIFPHFHMITCLAISACLTPTDPIICSSIVGGEFARKHIPVHLRHLISAESAANDGLAYPFMSLSLYLMLEKTTREAISQWLLIGCLYQVIFGTVLGTILGLTFSRIMKYSHRRKYIDHESYVAQYLALAVLTTGIVRIIGSDDLLATFAAGCAMSWDGNFKIHTEGEVFASVIEFVLNCACFIYIGAWLSFDAFYAPLLGLSPLRLIGLTCGIMVLRRIPAILILYTWVPEIPSWREALFAGHFGPMGVGAVFISTMALSRLPIPLNPPESQQDYLSLTLQPIVSFVVLSSIFIHGFSVPFFLLGRNMTRTLSTSLTLTNRLYPDGWFLGIQRTLSMTRQSDCEAVVTAAGAVIQYHGES